MNKLIIIGAGGHGKVLADNALKNGYTDVCFVDDRMTGSCMDFPIVGVCADIPKLNDGNTDFIIGIGNNAVRKRIAETYDVRWVTLIHPSAQIAVNVSVGKGTAVMAGAVINACATVGAHCIINTHAVVEHDNVLEDYVHISPNAALGGAVRIGERSWIGLGTAVINNIDICKNCIVGAGAVVVHNITESGTYISVPARKLM
jgi:sugar O-acyltransferase (sialic acid O-acetyltransferase NeuD family)